MNPPFGLSAFRKYPGVRPQAEGQSPSRRPRPAQGLPVSRSLSPQRAGLNGAIPARASSSARSFSGWPAWPLIHFQVTLWRACAASSRCHRSTFYTGLRSAVFQPLRFQPWIQPPTPFFT